jgi:hypothetical protein
LHKIGTDVLDTEWWVVGEALDAINAGTEMSGSQQAGKRKVSNQDSKEGYARGVRGLLVNISTGLNVHVLM